VLGGYDGVDRLYHCEKYSIQQNEWTDMAPMSKEKRDVSACILNNKYVYAIGGYDGQVYLNDICKYTITSDSWETMVLSKTASNAKLTPRDGALSFQIDPSCILIAGGIGNDGFLKDCYIFDTVKNGLKSINNNLPYEDWFVRPSTIIADNCLYAVGLVNDYIYKYDIEDGEWTDIHDF